MGDMIYLEFAIQGDKEPYRILTPKIHAASSPSSDSAKREFERIKAKCEGTMPSGSKFDLAGWIVEFRDKEGYEEEAPTCSALHPILPSTPDPTGWIVKKEL